MIANLIVFVSNPNEKSLMFAAAGAGVGFGGGAVGERQLIDTLLNPENKAFNELSSINRDPDKKHIVEVIAAYPRFFELIDFNRKEAQFGSIKQFLRTDYRARIKNWNTAVSQDESVEIGMFEKGSMKKDLKQKFYDRKFNTALITGEEGAPSIMREPNGAKLLYETVNPFDAGHNPQEVFDAIDWIFKRNFKNAEINELGLVAKRMNVATPDILQMDRFAQAQEIMGHVK
jgi:hypothetical protein